ncbi:MAG TPA: hypothetical protein VF613_04540 [Longimicrobium sp.]|jgi:hypothetical protein
MADFTRSFGTLARVLAVLCALAGAFAAPERAHAQTPLPAASDTLREIHLADGSVLIGRIEAVAGDRVTIVTQAGVRVELDRAQIRSALPVRVREGRVVREDPTGTRLFFAPTGRSLAAGEGYFGVYELFFPFLTYGVTDRFTMAAGTPVVPGAIGEFAYVAPKLTVIRSERLNVGTGIFAGFAEGELGGIAYGVGTWGDRDNAFSGGVGFAFGDGEFFDQPIVMLGGEMRAGPQLKLLTENYIIPGEAGALLSGGVRFFGERISADAGVGALIGNDGAECCLPLVNFVYTFGRK